MSIRSVCNKIGEGCAVAGLVLFVAASSSCLQAPERVAEAVCKDCPKNAFWRKSEEGFAPLCLAFDERGDLVFADGCCCGELPRE